MEPAVAVHALHSLPDGAEVELRSDWEYLIYGITVLRLSLETAALAQSPGRGLKEMGIVDRTAPPELQAGDSADLDEVA